MGVQAVCPVCDSTDYVLRQGQYFCRMCNTQIQELGTETVMDTETIPLEVQGRETFTMVEPSSSWLAQGDLALSLAEEVRRQYRKDFQTDCVLVGGNGKKARCHSVVLALASTVLRKIVPDPGDDREDTVLIIPDFGESELRRAVTLLYFGEAGFQLGEDAGMKRVEAFMETIGISGLLMGVLEPLKPKQVTSVGEHQSEEESDSNAIMDESDLPDDIISPCYDDEKEVDGIATFPCEESDLVENIISPCYEDDDVDDTFVDGDIQQVYDYLGPKHSVSFCDFASPSTCSKSCQANCKQVVSKWDVNKRLQLQTIFKCEKSIDTKNRLLEHLKSQVNIGLHADGYQINGHIFCCSALSHLTEISPFILTTVIQDFWSGVKFYTHGNAGILKPQSPTMMFIAWFKEFCECYGQSAPDENITVLSYWLNKRVLYDMYLDETTGPHVARSTFYENFRNYFGPRRQDLTLPCVRISKYSSHSVCTICVALNCNKRQCKTEAELRIAKEKINHHKLTFGLARRKIDEIIQSAVSFPSDNLAIQV